MPRLACSLVVALILVAPGGRARGQDGGSDENKAKIRRLAEDDKAAREASKAKKYDEAAKLYEGVLAGLPDVQLAPAARKRIEMSTRYNYGCTLALGGKKEKAVAELSKAIDAGFTDWKHVAKDTDWDGLREDDGFKKQAARTKEIAEKAEEAEPRLPFAVFKKAKAGDWAVYKGKIDMKGVHESVLVAKIAKVEGDEVTLEVDQTSEGQKVPTKTFRFDSTKPPTVRAFFDLSSEDELSDVKTSPGKETVSGKELEGHVFSYVDHLRGASLKLSAFFSPEVTVWGRVYTRAEIEEGGNTYHISYEIAGYGTASATTWGKTVDELEKAQPKGKKGE